MNKPIYRHWRVGLAWLLASFFYAYQYILRLIPSVTLSETLAHFQVDASQYGQYSGIYYIGYAGMHLPIGILMDRYGPKKVMPLCLCLAILGVLPLLYADQWIYPVIGRFLVGVGSSAAILGLFKVIRMEFSPSRFNQMLGISLTIGVLGAIYGGQPVSDWIHLFGLKKTLLFILGVGFILSLLLFWVIRGLSQEEERSTNLCRDLKFVLTHRSVLGICLLGGLMVGPLEGFADVWGASFLEKVYGFEKTLAMGLPSFIFIGFCLGSPLLSWFGDRTQAYFQLILACALGMGISFVFLLLGVLPAGWINAVLLFIGICSAYQIFIISQASQQVSHRLAGLTAASANMILMIFGYVFHSLIGKMMSLQWSGTLSAEGVPLYAPETFQWALSIIPAALFLAVLGFFYLSWMNRKGFRKVSSQL